MDKIINILYIYGGVLQHGGMEAYMMNYYRHMDSNKVRIDFVVHGFEKGVYDDEIEAFGGTIYHVHSRKDGLIKNLRELNDILKEKHYDIVHSHMDSANVFSLWVAKQRKVLVRISHSHNSAFLTNNKLKIVLYNICKKQIKYFSTHLFACSNLAGEWLYGKNVLFEIIPNAIDFNKFLFQEQVRECLLQEWDLKDVIVFGHIGRFDNQKNHTFLIDIFYQIHALNSKTKLILVGVGHLYESVKEKVRLLELSESVIFLGDRNDVALILNVLDCFLLPSLFEGLPVVLVEAQANGLPCFVSDNITLEANIMKKVRYLSLNESSVYWAKEILSDLNKVLERKIPEIQFVQTGYEIEKASSELQEKYRVMGMIK